MAAGQVDDEWEDVEWEDIDDTPVVAPKEEPKKDKGFLSRAWNVISSPLWEGPSRLARSVADVIDSPDLDRSPLAARIRGFGAGAIEGVGDLLSSLTSPIDLAATALTAGAGTAAKAGLTGASRGLTTAARASMLPVIAHGGSNIYEGIKEGDLAQAGMGIAEAAGGAAGLRYSPKGRVEAPIIDNLVDDIPEPPRSIRGLLEAPKDPYVVGADGRMIRRSMLTPQVEANLLGYNVEDVISDYPRDPRAAISDRIDLGELREKNRIANLAYTDFEHQGGKALTLPDKPIMDIPVTAGDTRLGFGERSNANLEYPLNVVPDYVRPRSAQTVTRALTGDEFARSIDAPEGIKFFDEEAPKIEPKPEVIDNKGGTKAIEPDEIILPSASPRVKQAMKENTGLNAEQVSIPKDTPEPVKKAVKTGVDNFVKETENPSFLMKSIYTQLGELGDAGKELVRKFQSAAQHRAEYDAVWTEPLFDVGKKLSSTEKANFGAYVEGRMPAPNERVKAAVAEWNKYQNMMGSAAVEKNLHAVRGKKIIPFEMIKDNYWPHIPAENLTKASIVDRLVKRGMSRVDATRVAKNWENTGEILIGAQHSRLSDEFKYKDDFDSAIHHGRSMSKRIANHENLGPKDIAGFGNEGIAQLIEDANDPKLAFKLAKRLAGRDELPNDRMMKGLNQARKWMSLTSLPNFTIPNVILGQATNAHMAAMSRHPIKVMKEISQLLNSSYRDEIRASGVFNSFNRTLLEELSGTDPFRIGTGEKINRAVAAAIGKVTVREAFNDFKSGKNSASAKYFLEELLSRDPNTITEITPELERFAAGRMAEITQGLNNPGNLPYSWSNPVNTYGSLAGQLMLIFKKVGFQVTKTIKDTIKADPKVAIPAWLAITQVAGEMSGDTKSLLTGKERPEELASRIADNWANAFMLGLPWELATSVAYGPAGAIKAVAGPAFGKASELGYDIYKTGENLIEDKEDPFNPLIKFGARNLPLPARERIRSLLD